MKQLKIFKQITNREIFSLEKYLQEINKFSLISSEMEIKLAKQIKKGNKEAFDKLITANLRFVISVSKQYQNQGLALADLVNEGNMGLIKAGKQFDETKGFKFISYAVWWIRQSILQALAENGRVVRLPLNKISSANKVNKAYVELEQQLCRTPSYLEIAKKIDISVSEVQEIFTIDKDHISMDTPISRSKDNASYNTLHDTLMDTRTPDMDDKLTKDYLQFKVNSLLLNLSSRDANIIRRYYGLDGETPNSLYTIGINYGLTRERVRQIKGRSIRKLKHLYEKHRNRDL